MLSILKNNPPLNDRIGRVLLKYKYPISLCVFLIHFAFKSNGIGFMSFWFDEAYSVYWSGHEISEIIEEGLKNDPNPPLYVSLLHYWVRIFGDDEYGIRLFSVVASSLAGSALFLFALKCFNWQTGIFVSVMYFVSSDMYFYAVEARTFSVLVLFSILGFHCYLSLLNKPRLWKAVLLGVLNTALIYFHLLAFLCVVGQCLLFPMLVTRIISADTEVEKRNFVLSIPKKPLICFVVSLVIMALLLYPWFDRLLEYSQGGIKNFWLAKPTYREFKDCVYDFFNSKDLFNVCLFSFIIILALVFIFRKLREEEVNKKLLLFNLMMGPGLLFINYLLAGYIPIFLKRYVLFTQIGFIAAFAYGLSLIRINIFIKLVAILVLAFFSFQKIAYPRPSVFDYDKAATFFKKVKGPDTFITNNCQDLICYYYDRRYFYVPAYHIKHAVLFAHGIYTPYNLTWPTDEDFSKYKIIYYSRTFEPVFDPEKQTEKALRKRFIHVARIDYFKGMIVDCFVNPGYNGFKTEKEKLQKIKDQIIANKEWYEQVKMKAKRGKISVEAMLDLDAKWALKQQGPH